MRKYILPLACVLLVITGSCNQKTEAPKAAAGEAPKLYGTIKDIMDGMVDPSADLLWDSVKTTIDASGITEKRPRTDEEWRQVRGWALTLIEAPNLLVMADRKVARAGEKSENPGIELEPEEMQKLLDADRATFAERAGKLQDAAIVALKAIDEKDAEKLLDAGNAIDTACENCHLKYWYPNEAEAAKARESGAANPK